MPRKQCGKSSCRVYIDYDERYCDRHKGLGDRQYNKAIRFNNENVEFTKFYQSPQWRKLSKQKRTHQPLCEHCLAAGRIRIADVVDHIIELKDDWSLRLEWSNLQSLCHECHNTKTNLEKIKRKK